MKKTKLIGIVALLFIMVMAAACVQAPAMNQTSGSPVIHYKLYGGFVRPEYSVQELVVVQDRATFTISAPDGNITERFEKALTREQFNAIVNVFYANNFSSYGDRYEEGQTHISDVGFADITFTADNLNKTVTTYNVNRYMPDGLIRIREKLQETIAFTQMPDEKQLRVVAENWIMGAPTYRYDGSDLQFVSYARQESDQVRHVLTYRFNGSHAGYGNRSDMVLAQVITGHMINVTIIDRTVEAAVIDGKWDETGQFLIGSETNLSYQPRMCEKTAWQSWEENSGRVYIRMPTNEEIITHYYASVYGINVTGVNTLQLGGMSCEACNVCLETYRFGLTVNASEMQPLLDEGWARIPAS
jgi:hypothetical protein